MNWRFHKVIREGDIHDVRIVGLEKISDSRGNFTKFAPQPEILSDLTSVAFSTNPILGTLRGLHFQVEPYAEEKLVTCIQGAIFDVLLDLRMTSPSFGNWKAFELSEENSLQVYLPKGIAHGFQTLRADTIVHYCLTSTYSQKSAFSLSPLGDLGIEWPIPNPLISQRDLNGISFEDAAQLYSVNLTK
jgi:dTDP-4-dehydrorhamnose 3,5-epimerase